MNEAEFHDALDALYEDIENAVDDLNEDVDCEISGSVLTLTCPDGSAIIFSRQAASSELWVAARAGGFHFSWNGAQWFSNKENRSLTDILSAVCIAQIGTPLAIKSI